MIFFLSAYLKCSVKKKCVACIAGVFIEMFARIVNMEKGGNRVDPTWQLFKTIRRTCEGSPPLRHH